MNDVLCIKKISKRESSIELFNYLDIIGSSNTKEYKRNLLNIFEKIKDNKRIAFKNFDNQLDKLLKLLVLLKTYNEDLKIFLYTNKRFEELDRTNHELLTYIDILVDGKPDFKNKDQKLWLRVSKNQRIINVNRTFRKHDGRIYLFTRVYLQEPNNTKYSFAKWLMVTKGLKQEKEQRAIDTIKFICRFDEDMIIGNKIDPMINKLIFMGGGRKKNRKLLYLFNRWCTRLELSLKYNQYYDKSIELYDEIGLETFTAKEILDYFKAYRKYEISIEKRTYDVSEPQIFHNYTYEQIQNRHKLQNQRERKERLIKKENKKQRFEPKKEVLNNIEKRMYKSRDACKVINKYRNKIKKQNINRIMNR